MKTTLLIAATALIAGLAPAQAGKNDSVANPNLASKEDLMKVQGINAALADAIIAARPHLNMLSVDKVLKAGSYAGQTAEIYKVLFVPINLNKTTREEIMLVPGMGARMAHEFEEYRPYENMAEFRKEIGKYVDAAEVARLEQFVFVPIDLNSASGDDILTIPGVGNRMKHEFEEYRPYKNIEQFRKEIGKYVNEAEVARLERFVVIAGAAAEAAAVINGNLAKADDLAKVSGLEKGLADAILKAQTFKDALELNKVVSAHVAEDGREAILKAVFVPINLNNASREEILLVPGVGARMAHEFEEYRPYKNIEQFRKEIGKYVDEAEVARLEQYVFVPIDLNSATREQILALPNVGARMAHEFEEYRPYTSIEQFRKEIGKYVDEKEVARLERYVFIGK